MTDLLIVVLILLCLNIAAAATLLLVVIARQKQHPRPRQASRRVVKARSSRTKWQKVDVLTDSADRLTPVIPR